MQIDTSTEIVSTVRRNKLNIDVDFGEKGLNVIVYYDQDDEEQYGNIVEVMVNDGEFYVSRNEPNSWHASICEAVEGYFENDEDMKKFQEILDEKFEEKGLED